MKILILTDQLLQRYGVSNVIMNYYSLINKDYFDIDFLLTGNVDDEFKRQIHGNIYIIGKNLKIIDIVKFFQLKKYDIIHSHFNQFDIFLYFIRVFIKKKYKIISHSHSTMYSTKIIKNIRNMILCIGSRYLSDERIACSKKAGNFLYKYKKYKLLYNAIYFEKFNFNEYNRYEIRNFYNIDNKTILFGHVGSFNNAKNHKYLIKVFYHIILSAEFNSILMLIGEGELKKEIKNEVRDLGLENKVIFVDQNKYVYKYLSAMDIFLMPSKFEGLPLTCIEAQVSGLPCYISKEITEEVKISKEIKFIDIKNSEEEWAKLIIKDIKKYGIKRNILDNQLARKYNIKEEIFNLEDIYKTMYSDHNI